MCQALSTKQNNEKSPYKKNKILNKPSRRIRTLQLSVPQSSADFHLTSSPVLASSPESEAVYTSVILRYFPEHGKNPK